MPGSHVGYNNRKWGTAYRLVRKLKRDGEPRKSSPLAGQNRSRLSRARTVGRASVVQQTRSFLDSVATA
ncbi:hypothetical protein KM043_011073 [Ampulex compressa]|nr:hypothetical protein KM043_011073 [Ampulex compressa]